MTRDNKQHGEGRCHVCGHDLIVGKDGYVYCSNDLCKHNGTAHPMSDKVCK